jgi:hypothetical protein
MRQGQHREAVLIRVSTATLVAVGCTLALMGVVYVVSVYST